MHTVLDLQQTYVMFFALASSLATTGQAVEKGGVVTTEGSTLTEPDARQPFSLSISLTLP